MNKTSSCVYLRHEPTGIEIKCQAGRSQTMNRFLARRLLCDRIEALITGAASAAEQERQKIRRQKRRRSRRQQERMLEGKRHRAKTKAARRSVRPTD